MATQRGVPGVVDTALAYFRFAYSPNSSLGVSSKFHIFPPSLTINSTSMPITFAF
jgi:hypothetical protein